MLSSSRFCEWNGHRPARTVVGVLTTNECDRETCKDFSQTETKSENQVCGWHFGVVGRGQEDKKVQTTKKLCCLVDRRWQTGEWNNNNNRSVIFFFEGGSPLGWPSGWQLTGPLGSSLLSYAVVFRFLSFFFLLSHLLATWRGLLAPYTHCTKKEKQEYMNTGWPTHTNSSHLSPPARFFFVLFFQRLLSFIQYCSVVRVERAGKEQKNCIRESRWRSSTANNRQL